MTQISFCNKERYTAVCLEDGRKAAVHGFAAEDEDNYLEPVSLCPKSGLMVILRGWRVEEAT